MTIQTAAMKNILSDAYKGAAVAAAVYTTAAGGTQGSEPPTTGTPAYARKTISWGSSANGVVTGTATLDIPPSATLVSAGVHSLVSGGVYLDGGSVTSQAFASQGTYALTITYTQT